MFPRDHLQRQMAHRIFPVQIDVGNGSTNECELVPFCCPYIMDKGKFGVEVLINFKMDDRISQQKYSAEYKKTDKRKIYL
jgi:hypothetical protein